MILFIALIGATITVLYHLVFGVIADFRRDTDEAKHHQTEARYYVVFGLLVYIAQQLQNIIPG